MLSTSMTMTVLGLLQGTSALQQPLHSIDCCKSLKEAGIPRLIYPNSSAYSERVESYWSLTSQLTPDCFVQPEDTEQVSIVVKILVKQTQCEFAVRSGGHSSNAGFNNIVGGVTIDLSRLNTTDYNPETKIASVRPGARWLGVYRTMDKLNRGIQGGGIGSVGVGGLLLGGGFADYAYQRGLATDDIHNFEVVLADGSIIQANSSYNQDLWKTLKGGGSGFGIVTRYDMYTFDHDPIWSSFRQYPAGPEVDEAHIRGLKHWTDNPATHESGSAYIWWTYRPADKKTIVLAQTGDTSGQSEPSYMKEFLNIPGYMSSDAGLTNMSTSAEATQAYGYRNIWWTLTFKNDERVIRKAVQLHRRLVDEMLQDSVDGDFETQCYFQPFPSTIAKRSTSKGGNILGINRIKDNAIVLLASLAVNGADQEALGRQKLTAWRMALEEYSKSLHANVEYRYMNYADGTQDVLKSYGETNVKKMMEVSKKYDPQGVFQRRTPGGFKLPWDVR